MVRFNRLPVLWLVALGLAGWMLSQTPFAAAEQALRGLGPGQWLAWLAVNVGIALAGASRWHLFTRCLGVAVTLSQLLKIRQAGQAVSFLTPGPQFGGEPLQVFWLHRRYRAPLPAALLALGLDRLYELAVNLLLLAAGVFLLACSPLAAITDWQAVGVGLIGALLSIAVAGRFLLGKSGRFTQALQSLFRRWRQHSLLRSVIGEGHDPAWDWRTLLGQRRLMVQALLWSLLGWAALLAELWLLLDWVVAPQGFWNFLLVMVAMRLAFLLPLPGGVGSLEMAMFWVFQYLHAAPGAALALIALMRVRDAVFVAAGLGCMAWLGGWRVANSGQA